MPRKPMGYERRQVLLGKRIYFKSENEIADVEARCAMLGGKSFSAYARDLIMIDLYESRLRDTMATSDVEKAIKKLIKLGDNEAAAELLNPVRTTPFTPEQIAESSKRLDDETLEQRAAKHAEFMKDLMGTDLPGSRPENGQEDTSGLPEALKPDTFKPIPAEELELESEEESEMDSEI